MFTLPLIFFLITLRRIQTNLCPEKWANLIPAQTPPFAYTSVVFGSFRTPFLPNVGEIKLLSTFSQRTTESAPIESSFFYIIRSIIPKNKTGDKTTPDLEYSKIDNNDAFTTGIWRKFSFFRVVLSIQFNQDSIKSWDNFLQFS